MGFWSSIFAVVFGIFWTIMAFTMGSFGGFGIVGFIFPLFGVGFVGLGIMQAIYHHKNATGSDRYSVFDITEANEEGDPGARWVKGGDPWDRQKENEAGARYCPWCSESLVKYPTDIVYCPKCGRKL